MDSDNEAAEVQVYLNQGLLKVVFVVEGKEQNRELLNSLFDHMGKWFDEHGDHIAMVPEMDGSSWRIHDDIIDTGPSDTEGLPDVTEIPDFLPREWTEES